MQGRWIRRAASDKPTIVFIHGVLSNGDACWKSRTGAFWPEMVTKDPELDGYGVWIFTYLTGYFSGRFSISDAASSLRNHLELDEVTSSHGLVLVCHSMGGIVARKYITTTAMELAANKTPIALYLVASPSLGSTYANWLAPVSRLLAHSQAKELRTTQSNIWLSDLDREFFELKEDKKISIIGQEIVEDQFVAMKWLWRRPIVESYSGGKYFSRWYKVPMSDHFTIAKPENLKSIQHQMLRKLCFRLITASLVQANDSAPPPAEPSAMKIKDFRTQLAINQMRLVSAGYDIEVDGILGQGTIQAVLDFQRRNKVEPTGTFNEETVKLLENAQEEFKSIQSIFIRLGYSIGADGLCGKLSRQVIYDFQQKYGLAPTGLLNAATRDLIARLS